MKHPHPFQVARWVVRRASGYHAPVYDDRYRPTGQTTWKRMDLSLTEVTRRLPELLDEASITSRKERGAVRRHLPVAYQTVHAGYRTETIREKLDKRIIRRAVRHVSQLPAGGDDAPWRVCDRRSVEGLALVAASWWYEYSRRAGSRKHEVAILTGIDEGQPWARRVPYSCATVSEALDYVRPAAVNQALDEGREVRRQGDIWLVRLRRGESNLSALFGTDHRVEDGKLVHPQHAPVDVSDGAWRAYLSKDTTRPMQAAAKWD